MAETYTLHVAGLTRELVHCLAACCLGTHGLFGAMGMGHDMIWGV